MKIKKINNVLLHIAENYAELCAFAAHRVVKRVTGAKTFSILVPAGTTPMGVYSLLSRQNKKLFNNVTCFNMDEYCEATEIGLQLLSENDSRSFGYAMNKNFFQYFPAMEHYFPSIDDVYDYGNYDLLIAKHGGLDLCLTGLGEDGHIFGFNFPGDSFATRTRIVEINENTIRVNSKITGEKIPNFAVTTGILTGMSAREIILIVSGKRKAKIIKSLLEGDVTEDLPASVLKLHPKCTWIVDEAAMTAVI